MSLACLAGCVYEFWCTCIFWWINDDDDNNVLHSLLSGEADGHESWSNRRDGTDGDTRCLPGRQSARLHRRRAVRSSLDARQPSDVSVEMAEIVQTNHRRHSAKLGHGDYSIPLLLLSLFCLLDLLLQIRLNASSSRVFKGESSDLNTPYVIARFSCLTVKFFNL